MLIVLEGPSDRATALTFRDIAETVQDGLHGLGHPSRIIYCTHIAYDDCVVARGKLIVLAAHNLASFFTAEGESAVLELNLLPPDAGKFTCLHARRLNYIIFFSCGHSAYKYMISSLDIVNRVAREENDIFN